MQILHHTNYAHMYTHRHRNDICLVTVYEHRKEEYTTRGTHSMCCPLFESKKETAYLSDMSLLESIRKRKCPEGTCYLSH